MAPLYVQYGCGFSVGCGWLNFDNSPTLRVQRFPIVGRLLWRLSGNKVKFPNEVKYGDICKGLPIPDNSVRGVYASHVLEHLAYDDFVLALQNTFRILEPGGIFRLIVPDLKERAQHYICEYEKGAIDASYNFLTSCRLGLQTRPKDFIDRIRFLYGNSAHLWMWDEISLANELEHASFEEVRRCDFGDAEDSMFKHVEDPGRFFDASIKIKELAMSARKPNGGY